MLALRAASQRQMLGTDWPHAQVKAVQSPKNAPLRRPICLEQQRSVAPSVESHLKHFEASSCPEARAALCFGGRRTSVSRQKA